MAKCFGVARLLVAAGVGAPLAVVGALVLTSTTHPAAATTAPAAPAARPTAPATMPVHHRAGAALHPKPAPRLSPPSAVPALTPAAVAAVVTAAAPVTPVHIPVPPPPAGVAGPTSWSELNAAIARIPHYQPGSMRWVISTAYGSWGTAQMGGGVIYISPTVPVDKLYDVAVHEWSHIVSVYPYHGDAQAAVNAMNKYFGGTGISGAEDAADCMALELGAGWTHYTTCQNASWRAGAARLIAGQAI